MKNILIVDDAMFMRAVLKNILISDGYNIVGEASNGVEAIEKYKELKPDIVTLDITMPLMDGIVALEELIKINSEVVVCMVSAMGQDSIIMESIKKGAKEFIIKPFQAEEVLSKIGKLI